MCSLDGCVISWVKLCLEFRSVFSGEHIPGRIIAFHSWLVHLKKKLYVFEFWSNTCACGMAMLCLGSGCLLKTLNFEDSRVCLVLCFDDILFCSWF